MIIPIGDKQLKCKDILYFEDLIELDITFLMQMFSKGDPKDLSSILNSIGLKGIHKIFTPIYKAFIIGDIPQLLLGEMIQFISNEKVMNALVKSLTDGMPSQPDIEKKKLVPKE